MKSPNDELKNDVQEANSEKTAGDINWPRYSSAEPQNLEVLADVDADRVASSSSDVDALARSAENERPNRSPHTDGPDDYTRRTEGEDMQYGSRQPTNRELPEADLAADLPEREG